MVIVKVKNMGEIVGKEVIQLYVCDVELMVLCLFQELKGYIKVLFQFGEEIIVYFELDKRVFVYYDVKLKDWYVEMGKFDIMVGKFLREIEFVEMIEVELSVIVIKLIIRYFIFGELLQYFVGVEIMGVMG